MTAPIVPISLADPASAITLPAPALPAGAEQGGAIFHEMFQTAVNTVEGFHSEANQAVQNLLSGQNEDPHTAIIATQRADLSFEMFMQVRNKVISAYQEIMRMQV